MSNKNNTHKSYNQHKVNNDIPITFVPLRKQLKPLPCDSTTADHFKKISKFYIHLQSRLANSIYKKLFMDYGKDSNAFSSFNHQEMKEIRNKYLLQLVESDPQNFPKELLQNDIKKSGPNKEEKLTNLLNAIKEAAKNEKKRVIPSLNLESRKSSINIIGTRRESMYEDIKKDKKKEKNKKEKNKSNVDKENDNGNNENYENIDEDNNNEEQSVYEEENYINNEGQDEDSQNYMEEEGDADEGGEY